jgi:carboxymethylenebutenolidase
MSQKKTETISLKISDGTEMQAYVARPNETKAPGLLVLQEAFGVNSHIKKVTEGMAQNGYLAIAPELFHRTAPPGWRGDYENFAPIAPHFQAVSEETLRNDLSAAFQWTQKDPQCAGGPVGSIGFCMGGRASWIANAHLPLAAAVSFYGGRIAPDLLSLAPQQRAPSLLAWGGLDQHIKPEQTRAIADALHTAKKSFIDVTFSDADHGFLCDERKSYQPRAAVQGWALALSFLATYLRK